jgi:alpha-beta hydrolase superfamily lysophospholipase
MPVRRKIMRGLAVAVGLYLVSALAGCSMYRHVLFPAPRSFPKIPAGYGELLSAKASDGVLAEGLFFPPPAPDAPFVIFFHGNGETVSYELGRAADLQELGFGVLLAEYRGYGTSRENGSPTEAGLYADAEALIAAAISRGMRKDRIALWGFSLGTGVASEMAFRGHGCALILEAPYTSIVDMGKRYAPFLPVTLIVKDKFDTLSKASKIGIPAIVAHGDDDPVVPFVMGEAVAHTLPHARFIPVKGGRHVNLLDVDRAEIYSAVADLLNSACRAPVPK